MVAGDAGLARRHLWAKSVQSPLTVHARDADLAPFDLTDAQTVALASTGEPMQTIPGIHIQVSHQVLTKPDPLGAASPGRHVSRLSRGDWLSGYCDSRYAPIHTTADHACGLSVILERYLTGIRGVTALQGSGFTKTSSPFSFRCRQPCDFSDRSFATRSLAPTLTWATSRMHQRIPSHRLERTDN